MKKIREIIICVIGLCVVFFLLNIEVETRQGINYQLNTIKIPLYLKMLDFYDRHYNYNELVKRINKGAETDEERLMRIFEWSYKNIRKQPKGLPIVDDHVWHVIVRGYGVDDQSADVFTVLCNYAGLDAFFSIVYSLDSERKIVFSFVRLKKEWYAFDSYRGVYFIDTKGRIVDIDTMKSGNWSISTLSEKPDVDYAVFIANLPSIKDIVLRRANIQSPLNRLFFEIKELLQG